MLLRPEYPLLLPGQVDAGLFHQAEILPILPGGLRPDPLRDVHQGHVAGVHHRLGQRLVPMAALFVAVDGLAAHHLAAAAGEVVVQGDDSLLQTDGHGDGLEHRPGLIGLGEHPVFHLPVPGVLPGGVGGLVPLLRLHPLHLGLERFAEQLPPVVGVKVRGAGHGKHRPRLGIDGKAEGPRLHVVGLDALRQGLLQHGLDALVHGEGHVIAVLGVEIHLIAGDHLHPPAVFGRHHPAQLAGQHILIACLDARLAHLVFAALLGLAHVPQDVGAHRGKGVVPLAAGGDLEARAQPFLADKLPGPLRVLLLQLVVEHLIAGINALHPLPQPLLIIAEQVHNAVHNGFAQVVEGLFIGRLVQFSVRFILLLVHRAVHAHRRQNQLVDRGGHGHGPALPVVDGAPVGGHGHAPGLLVCRPALPLLLLHDLELVELRHQREEYADAQHNHQKNGAPEQAAVVSSV